MRSIGGAAMRPCSLSGDRGSIRCYSPRYRSGPGAAVNRWLQRCDAANEGFQAQGTAASGAGKTASGEGAKAWNWRDLALGACMDEGRLSTPFGYFPLL